METRLDPKIAEAVNQFRTFFDIYKSISAHLTIDLNVRNFIEAKEVWIDRLEEGQFPVAFFGSFSAGKSTIINAILEREVLPEATQSTTAFPTLLRKGESDSVVIHYIDEKTKVFIWKQICSEISSKINQPLEKGQQESLNDYHGRIKKLVKQYELDTSNKIDAKPLEILEKLLKNWNNTTYQKASEVPLDTLKNYIEGHEDALFIDHIAVSLANISLPSDVVIVDLPGLAVANQRHIQFTKEYIQEKAKAFVVCMKPKHLLEGQEVEFLEATNRSNPTILQRSFWVINQWDTLNQRQREEEESNFRSKITQYSFGITPDRFFKVSALNHLLLASIANGTLHQTEKLKSHISNLSKLDSDPSTISVEKAKQLLAHEEVKSFSTFKEGLFKYLNTIAKDEFIGDAKAELLSIIKKLHDLLAPLYNEYSQVEDSDLEGQYRHITTNKYLDTYLGSQEKRIEEFAKNVRAAGSKKNYWNDSYTAKVKEQIKNRISEINNEDLQNTLRRGLDTSGSISRLLGIVEEKLQLTEILREAMELAVQEFAKELDKLLLDLRNTNRSYLPKKLEESLEDKLGKRDIQTRISGLGDCLFRNYGIALAKIGLTALQECKSESIDTQTNEVLEKYKQELPNFTNSLVTDLNDHIRRSLKNHTELLEKDLLKLFKDYKEIISCEIFQTVKSSEAAALETRKRIIIKNAYLKLIELQNAL